MDKLRQKYLQKWLRAQQQPVKKLMRTNIEIFANADDKNTMDVMYTLDRRVRTFAIDKIGRAHV